MSRHWVAFVGIVFLEWSVWGIILWRRYDDDEEEDTCWIMQLFNRCSVIWAAQVGLWIMGWSFSYSWTHHCVICWWGALLLSWSWIHTVWGIAMVAMEPSCDTQEAYLRSTTILLMTSWVIWALYGMIMHCCRRPLRPRDGPPPTDDPSLPFRLGSAGVPRDSPPSYCPTRPPISP